MADAKQCDRCGGFYKRICNPIYTVKKDNGYYQDKYYDLCQNCENELEKFLNVKKENTNGSKT